MPTPSQAACGLLALGVAVNLATRGAVTTGVVGLYEVVATLSLVLAWVSLVRAAPQRPWAWRWVLAGFSAWVVGDAVWTTENTVLGLEVYPAVSDIFYLLGYVSLAVGALMLARTRGAGRDRTAVLDAAIVAAGVAVPTWVFLVAPAAVDSGLTLGGKLVTSAYPLLDLFLVAVLARLLATPGARTGSYRALVWALLTTWAADAVWNAGTVLEGPGFRSVWADALWLTAYVLVAVATCHPSVLLVTEPAPRQRARVTRGRMVALAVASTLPAATLVADGWADDDVAWEATAVGAVALSLLVLARMAGLLEQVQVQAVQLSALARVDGLTGVPNRRTWDHELSRACAAARDSGEPLAVCLLDLDRFKRYNDQHGHQAGDRLLREAATAWTAELEAHGGFLARYGGEEFAVLLPGTDSATACRLVDDLRWVTPGAQSFSAGVAVWDPATDPDAAIGAADTALYEAKRQGRDRVVAASDGGPTPELPTWAEDTRVVLQPIVGAPDGRLVGHEASARFAHDADVRRVLGRAHEEGYGDLLEAHLLRRAVAVPGRPEGSELFVHLSTAAACSARFWDAVPDDLAGLVVELLEDLPPAGPREPAGALSREEALATLRRRGAVLAVDDLGAGRGDIGLLLEVRPAVVKVDRAVVVGCADDPVRLRLLELVVRLADTAGARVCAEGVDSAADLQALRGAGVHLVQGPHVGRPAPGWTVVPQRGGPVASPAPSPAGTPA